MNEDLSPILKFLKSTFGYNSDFRKTCSFASFLALLIVKVILASLYIVLIYSSYIISKELPYIFISFNIFFLLFFYAILICIGLYIIKFVCIIVPSHIHYRDVNKFLIYALIGILGLFLCYNNNVMDTILYKHKIGGGYPIKLIFRDPAIACQIYSDLLENPQICKMGPSPDKLLKSKNLSLVIMGIENKIAVQSQDDSAKDPKLINSMDVIVEYNPKNND